jgi:hypothetical protein
LYILGSILYVNFNSGINSGCKVTGRDGYNVAAPSLAATSDEVDRGIEVFWPLEVIELIAAAALV